MLYAICLIVFRCHLEMLLLKCNCSSVVLLVPHPMHMVGMQHMADVDIAVFAVTWQVWDTYAKGHYFSVLLAVGNLHTYTQIFGALLVLILCIFTLETVWSKKWMWMQNPKCPLQKRRFWCNFRPSIFSFPVILNIFFWNPCGYPLCWYLCCSSDLTNWILFLCWKFRTSMCANANDRLVSQDLTPRWLNLISRA